MAKTTIKQHDFTDCGVACIVSIAAHYGRNIPVRKIREFAGTGRWGTNVYGLLQAAQKIGFDAKGIRGDFKSLYTIPKPFIAHITIREQLYHYIVIYNVTKDYVLAMNPDKGKMEKYLHMDFEKKWTGIAVVLSPNKSFNKKDERVPFIKRFWLLIRPIKAILFQILIGTAIYALLGFSISIYLKKIIDNVTLDPDLSLLNLWGIGILMILIIQLLVGLIRDIVMIKAGQRIDSRLILGYYEHLLKMPQHFFDTMQVREIMTRINDAVTIRTFINRTSINLIENVLIVLLSFILMFIYNWKLALIAFSTITIYLLIHWIVQKLSKGVEPNAIEDEEKFKNQLFESLNSIDTIKRFGLEDIFKIKIKEQFTKVLESGYKPALNSVSSITGLNTIAQLFTIVVLWSGFGYVISEQMTLGELLFFYALSFYFIGPFIHLMNANKQIRNVMMATDRLFEIIDTKTEETQGKIILTKERIGDICFNEVTFNYLGRPSVLKKINLTIEKGKITAFVGESGSGKSTLLSLIQKMYPVEEGKIFIDNHDLKKINSFSLRKFLGVVPQKIDLFTGTIIENIAIGEKQPDFDKIYKITKEIGALKFIESLPNDFRTYLDEGCTTLSIGQKQLIAIARALYRNPEILILDQAISSLDRKSEFYVQRTLDNLRSNGTTILIADHNLSSTINADKIVVLDKGEIVELGSHYRLLEKKQAYFKLWQRQNLLSP